MNKIYLIGVVVISSILIVKRIYSHYKSPRLNKRQIKPEMSKKNKWLYPSDGFGKMEKGVVDYESKDPHEN